MGVRVYEKTFANEKLTAFLANRAAKLLHNKNPQVPKIKITAREVSMLHDYFGKGYARYTRKAVEAMKLAKELERVGIPTSHVCSILPVAFMVGSNRVVPGTKIVNPVGDADLNPEEEKKLRRTIVEKALEALQADVKEHTVFE